MNVRTPQGGGDFFDSHCSNSSFKISMLLQRFNAVYCMTAGRPSIAKTRDLLSLQIFDVFFLIFESLAGLENISTKCKYM